MTGNSQSSCSLELRKGKNMQFCPFPPQLTSKDVCFDMFDDVVSAGVFDFAIACQTRPSQSMLYESAMNV